MKRIEELVTFLKTYWSMPQHATHKGEKTAFLLACSFENGVEIEKEYPYKIPNDLEQFWRITQSAFLFKDIQYSQWGLEIFSSRLALINTEHERQNRLKDYEDNDLIIGRFIGDSDLLVVSCNTTDNSFGQVTISLPLDKRSEWPIVSDNFQAFLNTYVKLEGDKFWEV